MAREQGALFWELRAAVRGVPPSRWEFSSRYERFSEGFTTADLRSARALLDALR